MIFICFDETTSGRSNSLSKKAMLYITRLTQREEEKTDFYDSNSWKKVNLETSNIQLKFHCAYLVLTKECIVKIKCTYLNRLSCRFILKSQSRTQQELSSRGRSTNISVE